MQLCAQLESGHYPRETNKDTAHFENLAKKDNYLHVMFDNIY